VKGGETITSSGSCTPSSSGKDKSWGAPPIVSPKQAIMLQARLVVHNRIQNKLNCSEPRRGGLK
jgi:hypothetical protein